MTVAALSREDIDAFLRESGAGVLSLTHHGESYAIPKSFGYDGEAVYFQAVFAADSDKLAYIETTDVATLTVFTEQPARSVIVRGDIETVPDADAVSARRAIAANATVPSLDVDPDGDSGDRRFGLYRLTPDEVTGRAFGADAVAEG